MITFFTILLSLSIIAFLNRKIDRLNSSVRFYKNISSHLQRVRDNSINLTQTITKADASRFFSAWNKSRKKKK